VPAAVAPPAEAEVLELQGVILPAPDRGTASADWTAVQEVRILEQLALTFGVGVVARQIRSGKKVVGYEAVATHCDVEVTWGHEDPYVAIVGAIRDVVQESWKKNATICPEAPILVKPLKLTVVRRRDGEKASNHHVAATRCFDQRPTCWNAPGGSQSTRSLLLDPLDIHRYGNMLSWNRNRMRTIPLG
jgi:hypothetical protein